MGTFFWFILTWPMILAAIFLGLKYSSIKDSRRFLGISIGIGYLVLMAALLITGPVWTVVEFVLGLIHVSKENINAKYGWWIPVLLPVLSTYFIARKFS